MSVLRFMAEEEGQPTTRVKELALKMLPPLTKALSNECLSVMRHSVEH